MGMEWQCLFLSCQRLLSGEEHINTGVSEALSSGLAFLKKRKKSVIFNT